jgi:hypothetical protein
MRWLGMEEFEMESARAALTFHKQAFRGGVRLSGLSDETNSVVVHRDSCCQQEADQSPRYEGGDWTKYL